jgi:hypothetical protein
MNLKVKVRVHKPKPTYSLVVTVLQLDGTTVVAGPVTETDPDNMTPFKNVFTVPGPAWYLIETVLSDGSTTVMTCHKARKKK